MNALRYDVKSAVRSLLRNRSVTIIAVAMLALALGANTAIFSVVNGILLRPLPFRSPSELVAIRTLDSGGGEGYELSRPNFEDLRSQTPSLASAAAYQRSGTFFYDRGEPELFMGLDTTESLFDVLGVEPLIGRRLTPSDERPGAPPVALISHSLWQTRFGANPGIVGRAIPISPSGKVVTIVGILPPGLRFPLEGERVDLWQPLERPAADDLNQRIRVYLDVVGRLRPGRTAEAGQRDVLAVARRLEREYPATNTGVRFRVEALHDAVTGELGRPLWILLGAVAAVLLIACANVANLLLAHATTRSREVAIRAAVGGSRARIIRQLLIECALLGLVSGMAGLLLGNLAMKSLVAIAPSGIPRLDAIQLDGRVFVFGLALGTLTGILFGIIPALAVSGEGMASSLRESEARGATAGRGRNLVRSGLIVAEVALSLMLLVSAALLMRSFWNLMHVDAGFRSTRASAIDLSARAAYDTDEKVLALHRSVMGRIAAIPGVDAVAGTRILPFHLGDLTYDFAIVGRPAPPPGETPSAAYTAVTPGYFRVMGIPMAAGRDLTAQDDLTSEKVMVVSQRFARRHFPGGDALGSKIEVNGSTWLVVGIAGDVRQAELNREPEPAMYLPVLQSPERRLQIIARSSLPPGRLEGDLRAAVRSIDRMQPVIRVRSFDSIVREAQAARRLALSLLASLAALAVVLASGGIYTVLAYATRRRTREIGVRLAFGARPLDITRMVLGQAGVLVASGIAIGALMILLVSRLIARFLFGVSPFDPLTMAGVTIAVAAVSMAAAWIPARRAAAVDPVVAMRTE